MRYLPICTGQAGLTRFMARFGNRAELSFCALFGYNSIIMKKTFVIDGNNFKSIKGFYKEVNKVLCPEFKGMGRNFDAFNDILRGGFGAYEYNESIQVIWKNSSKSRNDLKDYDLLLEIFEENKNVELILE